MNALTRQIVDVYHAHADTTHSDTWARYHVHGLNPLYLRDHGFPSEHALIQDFKMWLRGKDVLAIYANDPRKEAAILNLPIKDLELPRWADRVFQPYHQLALTFKRDFVPILDKRCSADAHSAFRKYPMRKLNETELAKRDFGVHCSLYDVYELYLAYVTN